ncbi:MAG: hypothetical protein MNPFHGCM_00333 [Gemmatimonadaceae bacterium]|nr:hypothetical protein [Gemmatimonadaceae bacterium]
MALSHHDRVALTTLVERKLAGRRIARDAIRATVDEVCSLLDSSGSAFEDPEVLVVMSAACRPDFASLVRRQAESRGVRVIESGVATAGRHTVCVVRVRAGDEATVRAVCHEAGGAVASSMSAAELAA